MVWVLAYVKADGPGSPECPSARLAEPRGVRLVQTDDPVGEAMRTNAYDPVVIVVFYDGIPSWLYWSSIMKPWQLSALSVRMATDGTWMGDLAESSAP